MIVSDLSAGPAKAVERLNAAGIPVVGIPAPAHARPTDASLVAEIRADGFVVENYFPLVADERGAGSTPLEREPS